VVDTEWSLCYSERVNEIQGLMNDDKKFLTVGI
jgi:hypothetical protein